MAQDKYQPIVSDVKTNNVYINPGVQDRSAGIMANTVADLIPGAIKGYEGYQIMKVRQDTNEAIQQFENYVDEEQTVQNVAATRNAADSIWKDYEDQKVSENPDRTAEALNLLEGSYGKNVEKLKLAKQQGKMSDDQFLARVTQITRDAVVKNPWMEGEIYNAAQTHLRAMGITDLLDTRAKAGKSAADSAEATMKFYREAYKGANMLDKFDPSAGESVWQSQLKETQERAYRLQAGRDILEGNKQLDQNQIRMLLDEGGGLKFHDAEVSDYQDTLIRGLETATDPKSYDNTVASAKLQASERVRQYRQQLGSAALTQEGKDLIAQVEKDYNDIVNTLVEAGDGKRGAERLKNMLEVKRSVQSLEAREQYNPEIIDIATKVIGSLGDSAKVQLRKLGLGGYNSAVKTIINLLDPKNAGAKNVNSAIKSGAADIAVKGILEQNEGWRSRDNQMALTQFTATMNQALASGTVSGQEGVTALQGLLKTVAQNTEKFRGMPVNPEFSRQVSTAVKSVMGSAVPSLMGAINEVMENPANAGLNPPVLDVLPNGSFTISTGDAKADEMFNRAFSNKINDALDSYAAANGMTREKAAPQFYNDYLRIYVAQDPELEALKGGELKIQSPADAKAALDTKRITKREYDAIMKEGFK